MHPALKKSVLTTAVLACGLTGQANPPAWWGVGDPPVIVPGAASNNHGPANIGQGKHMAKSALDALSSVLPQVATAIEADLVGPGKPIPNWDPPADQAARDKNHAPLLTGQLKAIAHPFYVRLHAAAPVWLAEQRAANGTESGGIFPWTDASADDKHHGMANLGQLKAVFALHFTRDTDGDTLPDLAEHVLGSNPALTMTFTGLPDAWLATYYTSLATFVPTQDDDSDGLTNFAEYRHRTNPLNPDTDGDGTPDGAEVSHGGNPNNPGDGGNPPSDPVEEVEFTVGGDYATWRMEIKATGPRDDRTFNLTSPQPGQNETESFKLWKNNRYEITLHRTGGYEDWYCWQAQTDGQPAAGTFDADGWVFDGVRNEQAHFFTLAGHWLVDNREGLLSSHLHSFGLDVTSPLKAQLIPVAIEDNIEATGVDIVSNSVASEVEGYQDKLWIMAPIAGPSPPADYSNLMKFHIPLSPAADLEMECDHAAADPATVTLNHAKPEALWRGTGANETSDNIPDFKIGEYQDEVDLPIRVKTMKHRTVKVAVFPVRCKPGNRNVPMPDEGVLENWLNQVFAYQVNAWFDVEYKPQTDYDYDPDNDGIAPFWTKLIPMSQEAIYQDGSNDIRLFLIDWVSLRELGPYDEDLNGIAQLNPPLAVVNAGLPGVPARPAQQVIETIAHELGHVLVGEGHPDQGGGRAPLPGTDRSKRLMSTIATRAAGAKLLVKNEWDRAEERLRRIIDNQEQ